MKKELYNALSREGEKDPYAKHLGIRVIKVDEGYSLVEMDLEPYKANMFGRPHGGALFSLVDEAFAMASNSHGTMALALNLNITYVAPASMGSVLRAEAREQSCSRRIATYEIRVHDEQNNLIATSQALVYRKDVKLPFLEA